ncbi:cyclase (plasmid) [Streptomyces lunaelactis]|uniref:Cyclase n=1 Tax=Streptomyces lunaelactis TaxID=1535768 RepID=A0A2R4TFQ5_9ACTN|nr:aromatase/cyclase [Streptomyces lunaelactis]AVZ77944.1 cyclase [Streptomyces lunaelactis]NUK86114.1 SRPBCC family protein [Streptomyces lunaelactis]
MSGERVHRAWHSVEVAAPAGVVYGLIADAERWPLLFPSTVHVERLDFDGTHERLRMWATDEGRIGSWLSLRTQDPQQWRIEFRRLNPQAPVRTMNGIWTVEERADGGSLLTLLHEFTVVGDRPDDVAWVDLVTHADTRAKLAGVKRLAERWSVLDELVLSFEDSVRVKGPAEVVYDFLYRVGDWPELVSHVDRLELVEEAPGVQVMSMDTRIPDGSVQTTESVRMCFPHAGRIVHKQTSPAALLAAHTGEWSVVSDETGVTVVAQQTVVLCEEAVGEVLGEGADIAHARRHVREAVGRTSTAVLNLAKRHAESAIRML